MRKLLLPLALTLATAGVTLGTSTAAQANATPGCVTAWEYNRLYPGQTPGSVKWRFGTGGYEYDRYTDFVYDGMSDYDEFGNLVGYQPGDYYDEFGNWVDEQGGYERQVDHIRSYRKCYRFDGGRGRVGVLFDTYTYGHNGAYSVERYHPSYLRWWLLFDFGRSAGKQGLQPLSR